MNLILVPPSHIDQAWKDGAHKLSEACQWVTEITPDQLKLLLSRGEMFLYGLREDDEFTAWVVVQFDQLPNKRVLFVTSIWAKGKTNAFPLLAQLAKDNGCSSIRGACSDQVQRLWEIKFKAKKVYSIMEIEV